MPQGEYKSVVLTYHSDVVIESVNSKGRVSRYKAHSSVCYEVKPGQEK